MQPYGRYSIDTITHPSACPEMEGGGRGLQPLAPLNLPLVCVCVCVCVCTCVYVRTSIPSPEFAPVTIATFPLRFTFLTISEALV